MIHKLGKPSRRTILRSLSNPRYIRSPLPHFLIIRRLGTRVYYYKFPVILLAKQLSFLVPAQSFRVLKNGEDTLLEVAFPGMLSEFEMIFI